MRGKELLFSIKLRVQRLYDKIRLKNRNFTIISNNCWGGFVYQKFGLKYQSPTIGVGILDQHYFKFCRNIEEYLEYDLEFIDPKESEYYELRKKRYGKEINYPVARLKDIEIWFSHYKSKDEANLKWNRRIKRINRDKIIYKWSLRFSQDERLISEFVNLPLKNKIAFIPSMRYDGPTDDNTHIIKIPELTLNGGDETPFTFKHFNVLKYLNSLN